MRIRKEVNYMKARVENNYFTIYDHQTCREFNVETVRTVAELLELIERTEPEARREAVGHSAQ